jgi:hypothetical protein
MRELTHYKSVEVDGLQIFYREAGPPAATTILCSCMDFRRRRECMSHCFRGSRTGIT